MTAALVPTHTLIACLPWVDARDSEIAPIALDKDGIETTDFMESMCSQCVQLPSYQQLTGSVRERQENRPQRPGSVLGLPRSGAWTQD